LIKAEISTIDEEFEEFEKGRGPDKKPRKKKLGKKGRESAARRKRDRIEQRQIESIWKKRDALL